MAERSRKPKIGGTHGGERGLAVFHVAGLLWGTDAKLYLVIGMLVLYAVLDIAVRIMRRRLQLNFQRLDEVDQSELLEEQPDLEEELSPSGEVPLHWKLLDGFLGVSFAFGPPALVSFALKQPITLDSEFTGYHLLAMGAGVGI